MDCTGNSWRVKVENVELEQKGSAVWWKGQGEMDRAALKGSQCLGPGDFLSAAGPGSPRGLESGFWDDLWCQIIQLGLEAGDDCSEKWQQLWLWALGSCGAGQGWASSVPVPWKLSRKGAGSAVLMGRFGCWQCHTRLLWGCWLCQGEAAKLSAGTPQLCLIRIF